MEENKIKELKSRAYDLIALREKATQELNQINQMIAQEMQQVNAETKEVKVDRVKKA